MHKKNKDKYLSVVGTANQVWTENGWPHDTTNISIPYKPGYEFNITYNKKGKDEMIEEKRSQWMLLGVTPEAKEIVKNRAKKLKMGLGECVNKLIIDSEEEVPGDIISLNNKIDNLYKMIEGLNAYIIEVDLNIKHWSKPWWKK